MSTSGSQSQKTLARLSVDDFLEKQSLPVDFESWTIETFKQIQQVRGELNEGGPDALEITIIQLKEATVNARADGAPPDVLEALAECLAKAREIHVSRDIKIHPVQVYKPNMAHLRAIFCALDLDRDLLKWTPESRGQVEWQKAAQRFLNFTYNCIRAKSPADVEDKAFACFVRACDFAGFKDGELPPPISM
ncbi:uncharacterized protein DSM5745_01411 [Aspergillus mulundensis]|uniref:Uncharacterized protein n=1 Tax=Aspergillus mulundensis TaxID=1810919 RepID=A0A3D8T6C8_9EURO|nr:hypothetical protein DSM5745_01411 [Aspergillus mulundensis]RDW94089.1 hypothetical protein DSM5745_01411 [Aspergillus mulundensis]